MSRSMRICARCGARLPETRLFSSHTRSYYCADYAKCSRRAKRNRKARA